jgi:hypothetical protein
MARRTHALIAATGVLSQTISAAEKWLLSSTWTLSGAYVLATSVSASLRVISS